MHNPNSFSAGDNMIDTANTEKTAEATREQSEARGHEANEEFIREKEELLKRKAALEEQLRNAGVDVDALQEKFQGQKNSQDQDQESESENMEVSPNEVGRGIFKNPAARKAITIAAGAVLAAGLLIGGTMLVKHASANKAAGSVSGNTPVEAEMTIPAMVEVDTPIQAETEDNAEIRGIIDGYDKEGMWLSEGKTGPYAFADFEKVIEMHDGDVKEAIKDIDRNQVESMSDLISGLDNAIRPAGYEDLSMTEVNEKIEKLSEDDYQALWDEYVKIIDEASVKETTLNGKYDNAYMGVKDSEKIYGSKDAIEKNLAVNHDTMQLVKCTTNEKGSKAYELSWNKDGKTYTILVKDACKQVVDKEGQNPQRFDKLPEAEQQVIMGGGAINIIQGGGGTDKTTTREKPKDKPKENPPVKEWGKSGDPHAGTDYGQTIVTNPAVPDVSNINSGNQGYVDDNQANPGAPSEYNGVSADTGFAASGIVATGATTEGEQRLEGGQDQSDGQMAGENAYHSEADTSAGEAADAGGNEAQAEAQESNDVGGDNNSNSEEESRVAEGNF